ncbi:MAG: hypothetical protein ACYDH9_08155 [Limisphaerales bacterium]
MINTIPAAPGCGAHFEVGDASTTGFQTQILPGLGVRVQSYNPRLIDDRMFSSPDSVVPGLPVVLILPVGRWVVETSGDGVYYAHETVLESVLLPSGPSQHVVVTMTGPARWARYTRLNPAAANLMSSSSSSSSSPAARFSAN